MRRRLKLLIMVDAEGADRRQIGTQAADLRIEETGVNTAGSEECRHPVEVRDARANRPPTNLRSVPANREENGSIEEVAKVIGAVRVLPQVVAIDD